VSPQFEETAGKKFKRMPKAKASVSRNSKRLKQSISQVQSMIHCNGKKGKKSVESVGIGPLENQSHR
jgi:hypothetical protein